MGFASFTTPAGLQGLEAHLTHVSYVEGFAPSQADVAAFKALPSAPSAATYPHSARWYSHIQSYEAEHETLAGDASKAHTEYGPSTSAAAVEPVSVTEAKAVEEDDDEIDLFGSDDEEEDAAAEALKQERIAAYSAKKATKTKTIAKSVVTMDVKPWDDETDMAQLEAFVRSIDQPGLVWGLSKLVPIGYGIKKLQMTVVIEDDLVSLDDLQEKIQTEGEEFIQSTDIAAMQKL
ncbi:elongation factor 1-beta, partial [Phenoliferia sp. Uapishka_3]